MICCGLAAAVLPPPIVRPATMSSVSWPLPMFMAVIRPLTVVAVRDASSLTITPPVATWMKTGRPFASAPAHTGSYSRDQYGSGGISGSRSARRPSLRDRSISATASGMSVSGMAAVGRIRSLYRR